MSGDGIWSADEEKNRSQFFIESGHFIHTWNNKLQFRSWPTVIYLPELPLLSTAPAAFLQYTYTKKTAQNKHWYNKMTMKLKIKAPDHSWLHIWSLSLEFKMIPVMIWFEFLGVPHVDLPKQHRHLFKQGFTKGHLTLLHRCTLFYWNPERKRKLTEHLRSCWVTVWVSLLADLMKCQNLTYLIS